MCTSTLKRLFSCPARRWESKKLIKAVSRKSRYLNQDATAVVFCALAKQSIGFDGDGYLAFLQTHLSLIGASNAYHALGKISKENGGNAKMLTRQADNKTKYAQMHLAYEVHNIDRAIEEYVQSTTAEKTQQYPKLQGVLKRYCLPAGFLDSPQKPLHPEEASVAPTPPVTYHSPFVDDTADLKELISASEDPHGWLALCGFYQQRGLAKEESMIAATSCLRENKVNIARKRVIWEQVDKDITHNDTITAQRTKNNIYSVMERSKEDNYHKRTGELTYDYENVTNGSADTSTGGRCFGVEIEVKFPGGKDSYDSHQARIDLYRAGYTVSPVRPQTKEGYQSWIMDEDQTCDLEVVSPKLNDSRESWEQLEAILTILAKNNAYVDSACGGHINISTASYAGDIVKYSDLQKFAHSNDPILGVFASERATGRERSTAYCDPHATEERHLRKRLQVQRNDHGGMYSTDDEISKDGKIKAVNVSPALSPKYERLEGARHPREIPRPSSERRVEFRRFSGSLDPVEWQQRIKLVLAITDTVQIERENLDGRGMRNDAPLLPSPTNSLSSLKRNVLDRLYLTEHSKQQLTNLFHEIKRQQRAHGDQEG